MIVFLSICYVALLFVLIKIKVLPNAKWVWFTIVPFELVLLLGFFIPMQWGAPSGDVRTITYSVQITPNVAGEVIEVAAKPNVPLKRGDVLFRIDPAPYQAAVDGLKAQLALANLRLEQSTTLARRQAGTRYDVQSYQSQVDALKAQIANAQWNLDKTVVRAPSDGYVTNLLVRKGARAVTFPFAPVAAFIDTSELILGAQIPQIYSRHIQPGQTAEVAFKFLPGQVHTAKVVAVLQATAQGQIPLSGMAPQAQSAMPGPFFVRLELDDDELEAALPAGALGTVAIYTSEVTVAHVIRKVMIRMTAIMNYVMPF